jgi:hypothetical protein
MESQTTRTSTPEAKIARIQTETVVQAPSTLVPSGMANDAVIRAMDSDGDGQPNIYDETPFRNDFGDADGDGYSNYYDPNPISHDDLDFDSRLNEFDIDPYDSEEW